MKKRIILLLVILSVFVISFVGCGKNEKTENTQTITNPSNEVLRNIKSEYVITKDGKTAIKLTNNNESNLEGLNVNITYYDESGNLLGSDTQEIMLIAAKSEFIISSYLPYDVEGKIIYPGRVAINITNLEYDGIEIQNDKLGIKHNKSVTGNVIIECTNNSEKEVEAQVNVIYYKADNIVACDSNVYELKAKETKSEEFYRPTDSSYAEVEFDTYKLYYSVVSFDEEKLKEVLNNKETTGNQALNNVGQ